MWMTGPAPTTARPVPTGDRRCLVSSSKDQPSKSAARATLQYLLQGQMHAGGRGHADRRGGHRRRAPGEHGPGQRCSAASTTARRTLRHYWIRIPETRRPSTVIGRPERPSAPWGVNAQDGHKQWGRPRDPRPDGALGAATPRTATGASRAASPTTGRRAGVDERRAARGRRGREPRACTGVLS